MTRVSLRGRNFRHFGSETPSEKAILHIISTWPNKRSRGLKQLSILPKRCPLLAVHVRMYVSSRTETLQSWCSGWRSRCLTVAECENSTNSELHGWHRGHSGFVAASCLSSLCYPEVSLQEDFLKCGFAACFKLRDVILQLKQD
ncbi:hypothetical protein DAPPUDRAFT_99794 [Daphnia pulex]|uniref:Uncharacterized protein n=1 Tax=Daphnia pulex TaxID=6669 RepID=E9G8B2_DAPPU|nr:hypothetical protein DAPPUDRAFT_99794 [Daphnia pulex]|eukprot:EFX84304.1 hypothetical protein DAPPUDRAFT_99794 [Daphnia pulex]